MFHSPKLDLLLHQLLPRVCSLCDQVLTGPGERQSRLCGACRACLAGAGGPRCQRCALIHQGRGPHEACPLEKEEPFPWDAALSWTDYDYPVDGWIHALKFKSEPSLAVGLGVGLAQAAAAAPGTLRDDILALDTIVPLPLAHDRLASRGYNQAQLISKAFVRALQNDPAFAPEGRLHPAIDNQSLQRVRKGPPLSKLDAGERRELVRGAYATTRSLTGKRVGLIDDVMTTGSSLAEATRCLRAAGAQQVIVLVAARTP